MRYRLALALLLPAAVAAQPVDVQHADTRVEFDGAEPKTFDIRLQDDAFFVV